MNATVLVAEDDAALRLVVANNLRFVDYRVLEAEDGEAALQAILTEHPDLVLLDVNMPKRDGLAVLQAVRGRGLVVPVIFLTARAEEADRIAAFEIGADDYVVKPFSIGELLGRVKAILRRAKAVPRAPAYTFGDLRIDLTAYTIERAGRKTSLGFFEAEILRVLVQRAGEAVSRADLLDEVWGRDAYPTNRVVDNHVLSLRKKIEVDPANPTRIVTAHRVGYRFVP